MNTYLFTWNPNKWDWLELQDLINQLPIQKPTRKWATVSTKNIGVGDKFILIKIGTIPKNEKGIIGIGTIISHPFKDKDFLKTDKIRDFVTLEFDQLSINPLISLKELEQKHSEQKWTPEGSGILIRNRNTSQQIFEQILMQEQSIHSVSLFEKKIYFPIVAETIDSLLLNDESAHRDRIVEVLIENYFSTFEKIANNSGKSILFIAQNMVDWFSAELTKQSEIVAEWQNKYIRTKVKINGREITNYAFSCPLTQDEIIPEDIVFKEGSIKEIKVNAYERNPKARQICLNYYGYSCQSCGFDFEKIYGEIGKNYIQVHHIQPLSKIREEYVLDPIKDLIPVCANCHAMIHRKTPPYSIIEIKNLIEQKKIRLNEIVL